MQLLYFYAAPILKGSRFDYRAFKRADFVIVFHPAIGSDTTASNLRSANAGLYSRAFLHLINRPANAFSAGLFILLDFLMGNSVVQIGEQYTLRTAEVEELLRMVLLRHGYKAIDEELY